ncbi:hypothetical protein CLAFUW4_09141 [Fulvia fulva]|nr:hypothetical protein CLAFUR4_09147 [Fulvia fulva]KAK4614381.1 hypothetical protein CLAFUR0_09139 [Fulvia fulva]WPV20503.1 hypothetical protein CLAFUW4_09141 [Fulvia fulva]WPV34746.1 hypothetical protein CLAFUW7_09142 [Fulvia fulva]
MAAPAPSESVPSQTVPAPDPNSSQTATSSKHATLHPTTSAPVPEPIPATTATSAPTIPPPAHLTSTQPTHMADTSSAQNSVVQYHHPHLDAAQHYAHEQYQQLQVEHKKGSGTYKEIRVVFNRLLRKTEFRRRRGDVGAVGSGGGEGFVATAGPGAV